MSLENQPSKEEKTGLHPRNKHRQKYDFKALIKACPELETFVKFNPYHDLSIDFFDPRAVKALNKALLLHFYQLDFWDIPPAYLCPPIPGRADYIHHLADLLQESSLKFPAKSSINHNKVKCLDIGVGANAIYPIIGSRDYGWQFVGADIDALALESATKIVNKNTVLNGKIDLRLQTHAKHIFRGIIKESDRFDLTLCNPPFHASAAEAQAGSLRKLNNLKKGKQHKNILNFGGQSNELWCKGGEAQFVENMILESKQFSSTCFWFSTLISKSSNLKSVYAKLKSVEAIEVKTIPMQHGNKISRVVAWTFLTPQEQEAWLKTLRMS